MQGKFDINEVADMLEINPVTLRRWDDEKIFFAHRDSPKGHRYYYEDDIEDFLSRNYKYLLSMAKKWSFSDKVMHNIPSRFYCKDSPTFQARLNKLGDVLKRDPLLEESFSIVTSIAGEIGNNSFDHNLGNWPDIMGIFFGFNLIEKKIILADRGLGIFATLKNVKADLSNDKEAQLIAFTEKISGRSLEARGNGLKYVTEYVQRFEINLWLQSGKGGVLIDGKLDDISFVDTIEKGKGCFVILDYKNL